VNGIIPIAVSPLLLAVLANNGLQTESAYTESMREKPSKFAASQPNTSQTETPCPTTSWRDPEIALPGEAIPTLQRTEQVHSIASLLAKEGRSAWGRDGGHKPRTAVWPIRDHAPV